MTMDKKFHFPEMENKPSVGEIMVWLDENFTVGTEGQLIPRNPGPDIVIIDHMSKLK